MFLVPKMLSKFLKGVIIIVLAGIGTVIALYDVGLVDKCPIQQIDITGDLKKYDQIKNPELCAQLNEKISQFDGQCKGDMEELDCG
jgi:hypothetical protein